MSRILTSILLLMGLSACLPIKSDKPLLDNPSQVFDQDKVYKYKLIKYNTSKDDSDGKYAFFFSGSQGGYIEFNNADTYTAYQKAEFEGKTLYGRSELVIEELDRPFSLLSDYYILAFNPSPSASEKEYKYMFLEKRLTGDWYSYIPQWKIKYGSIKLKTKKELLKLANRIFDQDRDKAAKKISFVARARNDIDYIEFRRQLAAYVEEAQKEAHLKKKQEQKKLATEAVNNTVYLRCNFNLNSRTLLVRIDKKAKTIQWSPTDRPDSTTSCPLTESDAYSTGLCKRNNKPLKLDTMLVKPNYNYKALISSSDSNRCENANAIANSSGKLDFAHEVDYKLARKHGYCTARSWAKLRKITAQKAEILEYEQMRINRYSLKARYLAGQTVQIYSKANNTNYWTNSSRWNDADNGSCKVSSKPKPRF